MESRTYVLGLLAAAVLLSAPAFGRADELKSFQTLISELRPDTSVGKIRKLKYLEDRGDGESFKGMVGKVDVVVNTTEGALEFASFRYDGEKFDPRVLKALEKQYKRKFEPSMENKADRKEAWTEGGHFLDVGTHRILVGGKTRTTVLILGPKFRNGAGRIGMD